MAETEKNNIVYGVSKTYVAYKNFNDEKNEVEYGDYNVIKGITKVSIEAPKLTDDVYADDEVHVPGGDESNAPLEGTLSSIQAYNPILRDIIGITKDIDNKEEITNKAKNIGIAFIETVKSEDNEYDEILHVYYNVKLGAPKMEAQTVNEKVEEKTIEYPFRVYRANFTKHNPGPQSREQMIRRSNVTEEVWDSLLKTVVRMKDVPQTTTDTNN